MVSTLIHSIPVFLVVYGLFGGFGFCLVQLSSVVAVGIYFEKWRALATSIVICGAPTGMLTFAAVTALCINNWNWQDKFQITAILVLIVTTLGMLYRPLIPRKVVTVQERKVMFKEPEPSSSEEVITQKSNVTFSFHNLNYPTTAELHEKSTVVIVDSDEDFALKIQSVESLSSNSNSETSLRVIKSYTSRPRVSFHSMVQHVQDSDTDEEGEVEFPQEHTVTSKCKKFFCCCGRQRYFLRPIYRDDIFYNGSMADAPDYSKSLIVALPIEGSQVSAM